MSKLDMVFDGDKVKKEELEKAEKLLNEASEKIEDAAKIFCVYSHDEDDCYEECPALIKEGWGFCYFSDAFDNIDMILEKIELLKKNVERRSDDERKR